MLSERQRHNLAVANRYVELYTASAEATDVARPAANV